MEANILWPTLSSVSFSLAKVEWIFAAEEILV